MIDMLAQVCILGFSPCALAALVITWLRLPRLHDTARLAVSFLFSASVAIPLAVAGLAITMRDGLGPGMIPSTGWLAIHRSADGVAWGVVGGIIFFVTGLCILRYNCVHTAMRVALDREHNR
jgi:hypothetical protein